jgi:glutathione S-transferase
LQLIYSALSPFARKVRVVLAEKGMEGEVEVTTANPWEDPEALTRFNPISQVPTLVLDDGTALYDSPIVCAWLDAHGGGPRLIPEGEAQWPVRRLEAVCDAIMETGVKLRQEEMRPEGERSSTHPDRWARTVRRAFDALEAEGAGDGRLDLGAIALVCALEYIDFRAPYLNWREGRPNLVARYEALASRPSFRATAPA